ncbi:MAG: nucleotide sugar dehydrogenase [Abditibacteriales bacterium]|nr:nucleotide sugar dehydrogenase [Abditibacteriales bacterium]MDW8365033.1 nucleotide sugar dehydrogenase [Abditibacteriales bacterium]
MTSDQYGPLTFTGYWSLVTVRRWYPLSLIEKFEGRSAKVAVIGMGYVGLPLAVELGNVGFEVWALDVDEERVESLRNGKSYITDVPDADVQRLREARKLRPTADPRVLERVDAAIICVPTPLTKTREPDLSYVIAATENVACHLQPEQLVVLESTTYPGTTEEIVLPRLQKMGWELGRDFHLAFSPERIDPGNKKWTLRTVPKVVGGVTPQCTQVACALYRQIVDRVVPVSSPKVAELTKLLENVFRSVNIALVNELMLLCDRMGIDVWEVIEAASTKPYGFMKFTPGPGLGGHCLEGGETVCVKSDSGVQVLPVKALFERCKTANDGRLLRFSDAEVIVRPNVEVLSLDLEKKQTTFQPAEYLFRRQYCGNLVTIKTAAGTTLRVTDLHPMLVERDGAIMTCPAERLAVGDRLPLFAGFNGRSPLACAEYATVPVRHLEVASTATEVYSLEVQGTHTFATSGGIFVHNCIPVDPFYLSWKAKEYEFHTKFIELSGEVNTSIPHYVLSKVTDALNAQGKSLKGATVLMLGLAYKADVNDVRESPSLKVAELLLKKQAHLIVNDPHVASAHWNGYPLISQELTADLIRQADCVLLMTNHSAYDYAWIAKEAKLIVDTRNAFAGQAGRIVKL